MVICFEKKISANCWWYNFLLAFFNGFFLQSLVKYYSKVAVFQSALRPFSKRDNLHFQPVQTMNCKLSLSFCLELKSAFVTQDKKQDTFDVDELLF